MKGHKVFVTGIAGFVGFHLAQALQDQGARVVGYDNFNDYYDVKLKRERQKILQNRGLTIIEGDLCDFDLLKESIRQFEADHIIHLAAQAGVRYSLQNPQAYVKSNLEGFVNILEICKEGLPLVYASSSSVYGLNEKTPFAETDSTDRQASLYGATKKSNELMAQVYHHLYKFPVTGLRFFTVYGPWGRPDMAYYSFTKAILEGRPIDVYADGKLERDFTYVDDIVAGIIAAIKLKAPCEIFNLGNHRPVTVNRFIEVIEQALGKKAIKRSLPMQQGDVIATYADIEHSRSLLGFEPRVSLEEGIAKFVGWYREYAGEKALH